MNTNNELLLTKMITGITMAILSLIIVILCIVFIKPKTLQNGSECQLTDPSSYDYCYMCPSGKYENINNTYKCTTN